MSRPPTILISDDERPIAMAMQRELKRMGMTAIIDTDSNVVELAKAHRPDLIVLDVHQRVDGRDLLAHLKHDPSTKDLPVIVLSGIEDQFVRHTCLELGAYDYEVKPFDPGFIRRMFRMIHDREAQPAAA